MVKSLMQKIKSIREGDRLTKDKNKNGIFILLEDGATIIIVMRGKIRVKINKKRWQQIYDTKKTYTIPTSIVE